MGNDPCLTPFLTSRSDDEARDALSALLADHLGPVMRDTVTRQLVRSRWTAGHIDDVMAELRVKITGKLWSLRSGTGEPVEDLLAYCATESERSSSAFLRRHFPRRTRLRNQIRYALTHHGAMTLEADALGVWRCRSTGMRLAAPPGSTRMLLDDPRKFAEDRGLDCESPLPLLVAALLDDCDEPIEFDRLVDAVAALQGVSDPPSPRFDAATGDVDHPDYELFAALVDDGLDDVARHGISAHLERCEACREDVDDLTEVKASLQVRPAYKIAPPEIAPPARRWMKHAMGFGTVAAAVATAIWIGSQPAERVEGEAGSPAASTTPVDAGPAIQAAAPVRVPVLTEEEEGRVKRALATGRLELPPNMAVLRGHKGTPLDTEATASFAPTMPLATAIVEARPQFSWTPMAGATRYSITIFDERFREVTKSGSLKITTWTPSRDLPRGRVLQWQITAVTGNSTRTISPVPPQPEARFVVLDSASVAEITKQRERLATEPVALGLVLAKAGLFAEAERVLESAVSDERYSRTEVRGLIARLRAR